MIPKHLALASLCAFWPAVAFAQGAAVQPPCGTTPVPSYSQPGSPPTVTVLTRDQIEKDHWQAPSCTGWTDPKTSTQVIALAGSFRFDGDLAALLTRAGAVSSFNAIQYWSVSEKKWRPLIYKASPLSGPDPKARRGDFMPAEMTPGQALHYWVEDSRLGEIVYEQKVLERGANRVVIATRNVTPVKYYLVTLFEPGQLESVEFLDQLSPGVWGMYALSRTPSSQVGDLLSSGVASLINRAVAVYRRVAGIPTDQEPPAAP